MRFLVLSDIHGAAAELQQALTFMDTLQADFLVLLGDILNHGPRNKLPESYNPPAVAALLNPLSHRIISVRGNCDSEVDGMMLDFPCNAPYGWLIQPTAQGPVRIMLTHGHLFDIGSEQGCKKAGLQAGDIVLSGHTHVAGIFVQLTGVININPGSISLPKGGTQAGFILIDDSAVRLYNLQGKEYAAQPLLP